MKPTTLLWAATLVVCAAVCLHLTGCNSDDSKPAEPIYATAYSTPINDRQKLVDEFKSTEVFAVPGDNTEFLVRDNNGVVWFIKSNRNGAANAGKTLVFVCRSFAPRNDSTNR